MDDLVEDKIIYQLYLSHLKLFTSKVSSVKSRIATLNNMWNYMRFYLAKPEIILCLALIVCLYAFTGNLYQSIYGLAKKINRSIKSVGIGNFQQLVIDEKDALSKNWSFDGNNVALYAIKGRRSQMEDRYVIKTNVMDTEISLFAVFDGHGGEFAAEYATINLMPNLMNKIIKIKQMLGDKNNSSNKNIKVSPPSTPETLTPQMKPKITKSEVQTSSKIKQVSFADDTGIKRRLSVNPDLLKKDIQSSVKESDHVLIDPSTYISNNGSVNFSKLLIDEVLLADKLLIEIAKRAYDIAGSTALIALVEKNTLFVANVGDSRGVMCDKKGNAIPLSFDHKPQQMREKKRIADAGGFISFNGVWRVAGVLATSRALGDYPLKENKYVIADPDVLTFDLAHHEPQFIILASDGLWDTFTNEEAVECIKQHINDPFYGAKYLTLQSFNRGSLDNITVLVIKFPPTWSQDSQTGNNASIK